MEYIRGCYCNTKQATASEKRTHLTKQVGMLLNNVIKLVITVVIRVRLTVSVTLITRLITWRGCYCNLTHVIHDMEPCAR
jgi:hypothetical protein